METSYSLGMATTWVPLDTFGTRLILLRRHLQVSVDEISPKCGQSPHTWATWERGATPRNMATVVAAISASVGVDRDWLMWGGPLSERDASPWLLPIAELIPA
jgi:hypothetical protein